MSEIREGETVSSVQQNTEKKYDYILKLLMVGNSSVGKTSFISRYCKGEYSMDFQPTVGIDYWAKQLVGYVSNQFSSSLLYQLFSICSTFSLLFRLKYNVYHQYSSTNYNDVFSKECIISKGL